jgi:hypothetical protein
MSTPRAGARSSGEVLGWLLLPFPIKGGVIIFIGCMSSLWFLSCWSLSFCSHCHGPLAIPVAPHFHPVSSCSQWWVWVLGHHRCPLPCHWSLSPSPHRHCVIIVIPLIVSVSVVPSHCCHCSPALSTLHPLSSLCHLLGSTPRAAACGSGGLAGGCWWLSLSSLPCHPSLTPSLPCCPHHWLSSCCVAVLICYPPYKWILTVVAWLWVSS